MYHVRVAVSAGEQGKLEHERMRTMLTSVLCLPACRLRNCWLTARRRKDGTTPSGVECCLAGVASRMAGSPTMVYRLPLRYDVPAPEDSFGVPREARTGP